jgi:hypothetical protein
LFESEHFQGCAGNIYDYSMMGVQRPALHKLLQAVAVEQEPPWSMK